MCRPIPIAPSFLIQVRYNIIYHLHCHTITQVSENIFSSHNVIVFIIYIAVLFPLIFLNLPYILDKQFTSSYLFYILRLPDTFVFGSRQLILSRQIDCDHFPLIPKNICKNNELHIYDTYL